MAIDVLAPPLGQTTDTVVLANWYKREGDTVTQGEPLFAIETDKATLDVEAPASGTLRNIKAQAGDEVKALSVIAVIIQPAEQISAAAAPTQAKSVSTVVIPAAVQPLLVIDSPRPRVFISPRARRLAEQKKVPLEVLKPTGPEGAIIERDVRAYLEQPSAPAITPVARRMAEEAGLDWTQLTGSGAGGRVMRQDITQAVAETDRASETAQAVSVPPVDQPLETVPVSSIRAVIGEKMVSSHTQTAPVTLTSEVDATALVNLRSELAKDDVEASYNDLFIVILARALREHPRLNASLDGKSLKLWSEVHIGLAVDTERGLLAPVIRHVGRKGLKQIAQETRLLVERARAGQCTPDELSGSTFTLTNLGMYGIDAFTPIINLPECAILGVGRIKTQPVMLDGAVVGRQMVWLSLTFDHRLVDGGPAARFLQRVAQLIERPHLLIT
jgi:pyruvate dehydrogenase E2 component (dihydrolipoamide acetyltransferase)